MCNVQDENVDIIYVSPFPIPEDVAQYYHKLLQLGGVQNPDARVRFVYPENFVKYVVNLVRDCIHPRPFPSPFPSFPNPRSLSAAQHIPVARLLF